MSQQIPDDKIHTVVGMVLEAVDQRLNTVREQLVQLAKSVARNQTELQKQVDQCRMMCEIAAKAPNQAAGEPNAAASQQLFEIANLLTQQVTSFEARVNQYTNERVAELAARLDGGFAERTSQPVPVVQPQPERPSQPVAVIAPLPVDRPGQQVPAPNDMSPAAARLGSLAATSASTPPAPKAAEPVDLETLTAQMSERLSAAIEKALGVA